MCTCCLCFWPGEYCLFFINILFSQMKNKFTPFFSVNFIFT
ncbi:putative signal peptide protein [Puccinia sorghi]|uniref:Putative signal peptide protein n=1 Tax=Puccinia sorghi TaxID=27349 RepID=A0A0L6VPK6_9BASI|nr:putative signal peptide protein [Puccinia sorghi]